MTAGVIESYQPVPIYDLYILFIEASFPICSANFRSVMAGGRFNGAFSLIFSGMVLSINSSNVFTPILSSILGRSFSVMPIWRLAKNHLFLH